MLRVLPADHAERVGRRVDGVIGRDLLGLAGATSLRLPSSVRCPPALPLRVLQLPLERRHLGQHLVVARPRQTHLGHHLGELGLDQSQLRDQRVDGRLETAHVLVQEGHAAQQVHLLLLRHRRLLPQLLDQPVAQLHRRLELGSAVQGRLVRLHGGVERVGRADVDERLQSDELVVQVGHHVALLLQLEHQLVVVLGGGHAQVARQRRLVILVVVAERGARARDRRQRGGERRRRRRRGGDGGGGGSGRHRGRGWRGRHGWRRRRPVCVHLDRLRRVDGSIAGWRLVGRAVVCVRLLFV